MRIPRIHVSDPLVAGAEIVLPEQAGEHVARVLRLERGHPLVLFNGNGREYRAEISQLAKRAVSARVLDEGVVTNRESPLQLTLAQGIARGDKMDLVLQKATELGVSRIIPLITVRTEVKLDAERTARRLAHWQAVIAGACEQSGRTTLPTLEAPLRLAHWAAALNDDIGLRLVLNPNGDMSPRALSPFSAATLVAGPEGGLSDQDLGILDQVGFVGLRLGPRILRTETAASPRSLHCRPSTAIFDDSGRARGTMNSLSPNGCIVGGEGWGEGVRSATAPIVARRNNRRARASTRLVARISTSSPCRPPPHPTLSPEQGSRERANASRSNYLSPNGCIVRKKVLKHRTRR